MGGNQRGLFCNRNSCLCRPPRYEKSSASSPSESAQKFGPHAPALAFVTARFLRQPASKLNSSRAPGSIEAVSSDETPRKLTEESGEPSPLFLRQPPAKSFPQWAPGSMEEVSFDEPLKELAEANGAPDLQLPPSVPGEIAFGRGPGSIGVLASWRELSRTDGGKQGARPPLPPVRSCRNRTRMGPECIEAASSGALRPLVPPVSTRRNRTRGGARDPSKP